MSLSWENRTVNCLSIGTENQLGQADTLTLIPITPSDIKKSVINNLVDRAVLLSDIEFQKSNLKLITDTLEENDYPIFITQEIINQRLLTLEQKTRLGNNHIDINAESKSFISIPYIEGLSEKISGILHSYNLNTAYKNKKTLKWYSNQQKIKYLKNIPLTSSTVFLAKGMSAKPSI